MHTRKSFEYFADKIEKISGEKPILTFRRWTRTSKPILYCEQKGWKTRWTVYYTNKTW